MTPPVFPLLPIAPGDLNIAVVGQLPPPYLSLGDQFEPRPMKVVGFKAAFRRRGLWKQDLENAPRNAHHSLVFADSYAELDDATLAIPSSIGWKAKKHAPPEVFCYCSQEHLTGASRCRVLVVGYGPVSVSGN